MDATNAIAADPSSFLRSANEQIASAGFAVLRAVFPKSEVETIRSAAVAFYDHVECGKAIGPLPRAYLYNPGNMATSMSALDDFGTKDYQLLRVVANSPVASCLRHYLGDDVLCSLTHSRMRKSYPRTDNRPRPSTVAWHT